MKKATKNKGFTLIEILLVVVIIGVMLAVIVPRAWRANIDSKYGLVRQSCSELASFGMEWAEEQSQAQADSDSATIKAYLDTLAGDWVASTATNWMGATIGVSGRSNIPQATVNDIVPPEKHPRNPFSGPSVFSTANNPGIQGNPVPGAIYCGSINETTGYQYYAFLFQGTDSTEFYLVAGERLFHGGQDNLNGSLELEEFRNGIFFARAR